MRIWVALCIGVALIVAMAFFYPTLLHYLGQIKHYLLALLGALFLYKGKLIATFLFQRLIKVGAKELSKRYVIEHIISKRFKEHLIAPAKEDMVRIVKLWKKRAKKHIFIGLVATALSVLFGSALFVRVMGVASVIKVLMARFWSAVLKLFLILVRVTQKVLAPLVRLYRMRTLPFCSKASRSLFGSCCIVSLRRYH